MPNSYGILTPTDLEEVASGPIPYLLDDYIPEKSIGILVGEWGLGKSPLALQMQLSMSANLPFLGRYKAAREGLRTLYVDFENGARAVLGIANKLSKHLGLEHIPEGWSVYSPNYSTKLESLKHLNEDVYIRKLIYEQHFDFVVIDPLRIYQPEAEAKNSMAAAMIKSLRTLVNECNTSILLIHHPRKPSEDPLLKQSLEADPTGWMARCCGAASLVQNTDFRIGLEQTAEEDIICRRFLRNLGWSATEYIDRAYDDDEPIGYTLVADINKLQPIEARWFAMLSNSFTTLQAKTSSGKNNNRGVNDWLKRLVSLRLIKKNGYGSWIKL